VISGQGRRLALQKLHRPGRVDDMCLGHDIGTLTTGLRLQARDAVLKYLLKSPK